MFVQTGTLLDVAEAAAEFMKTTWRTNKMGPVKMLTFQGEKARWAMETIRG